MKSSQTHQLQLKKVDQIGIVVRDADKVMESWTKLFGIGPWRSQKMGGTDAKGRSWKARLVFANLGTVQLELIQVVEGRLFHSRFLEEHGEGIHHLGFYADDVDGEAANLVKQGAKVLFANPGNFIYLDIGGPGGVIYELIKRPA